MVFVLYGVYACLFDDNYCQLIYDCTASVIITEEEGKKNGDEPIKLHVHVGCTVCCMSVAQWYFVFSAYFLLHFYYLFHFFPFFPHFFFVLLPFKHYMHDGIKKSKFLNHFLFIYLNIFSFLVCFSSTACEVR